MRLDSRRRTFLRGAAARLALVSLLILSGAAPAAAQDGGLPETHALAEQSIKLFQEGKHAEGISSAERALALMEKALGPEHNDVGVMLGVLAMMCQGTGDARAESLWTRAISIMEKAGGAENPDLAGPLNHLAMLYFARADLARAEPLLTRSVALYEKTLGADHQFVASALNNLATISRERGDFARSESLLERALPISEKAVGAEHAEHAAILNNLAMTYLARGDYARAEPLFTRALAAFEKAHGPEHPALTEPLFGLGELHRMKGAYALAEPLFLRALAIFEKAGAAEHPVAATILNSLGAVHVVKGDFDRAEALLRRGLAAREKAFGPDHPTVAVSLNNLAELYRQREDYARAEPLYARVLAIHEKAFGPEHPLVAMALNNQASFFYTLGDFARAEPLLVRAHAVWQKALGPDHAEAALAFANLGELHARKGDIARAEQFYQRALAIREKAYGPDHPEVAQSLNTLGIMLYAKGDFGRVEPLLTRSLVIRERAFGRDHHEVAAALLSLADLYRALGDYARAEPLYARAVSVYEKALGPEHTSFAQALNNFGLLYYGAGNYEQAEPLLVRALAIREKKHGPDHPDLVMTRNNLAVLYLGKGDYERAEAMLTRVLSSMEKTLGPNHPHVGLVFQNLAVVHYARGDVARALQFFERMLEVGERNLSRVLDASSDRQKLAYLTAISTELNVAVSLGAHAPGADLRAIRLALTTVLRRKGRALDAMAEHVSSLRRRLDPQDRALLDKLAAAQSELSALAVGRVRRADGAAAAARVEAEIERLQDDIGRRSAEFRLASQPVTVEQVRAALPAGSALVEFITFRPFNVKGKGYAALYGHARYAAYVLRAEGEPLWVDLGEAWAVEADVARFRAALRDPASDPAGPARALDERVMRPVRKLLGGARQVFVSPDGVLNLIPFAALVDESGKYLIESHSITYLTSGRDLPRLQAAGDGRQPPLVVADPLFGPKPGGGERRGGEPGADVARSVDLKQVYFERLPGTADEAKALARVLPGARVLTQAEATETALKQVSGPRVLHVATHGFFLPDQPYEPPGSARGLKVAAADFEHPPVRVENPLLRSGLALGGANSLRGGGDEDGILTALEAAGLDLWGTKLVVLSACETGVGEVRNGEGVYGLRRALVIAGSESQVISLWQVSDAATRDLMVDYYNRLTAGEGRTEALRRAQLSMLGAGARAGGGPGGLAAGAGANGAGRSHPFFWAAFIQSGDWRAVSAPRRGR